MLQEIICLSILYNHEDKIFYDKQYILKNFFTSFDKLLKVIITTYINNISMSVIIDTGDYVNIQYMLL